MMKFICSLSKFETPCQPQYQHDYAKADQKPYKAANQKLTYERHISAQLLALMKEIAARVIL
jgi:hypothetical protein